MTDDERLPSEMPYRRTDGACDICGAETDKLRRVTLKPASGSWGSFKAARVVYVCANHDLASDVPLGPPPTTRQLAPGTTRRAPQDETLFLPSRPSTDS